jgi:hypothetical protein
MQVSGYNIPHLALGPHRMGHQIVYRAYIPIDHFSEKVYIPGFHHKHHLLLALGCREFAIA